MKKFYSLSLLLALVSNIHLAMADELTNSSDVSSENNFSQQSTIDDQTAKFKLASQLKDMYPGNNIEVTVFNDHALLSGQVKTAEIKTAAENFARKFEGI